MHSLLGRTLDNRYRLLRLIGQGGMGAVFEAEQVELNRRCAVKILLPSALDVPTARQRFVREAHLAARITHPNIVNIFDQGVCLDGLPYIVMEYIEGESLMRTLERERSLSWVRAKHIILQVCHGLESAHSRGIIHRDLKPGNCMRLTANGDPDFIKLVDFGIAKALHEQDKHTKLTQADMPIGTVDYMSYEQAYGVECDHRADVWAVGVMLYELVSGCLPFRGSSPTPAVQRLAAILSRDPTPLVLCIPVGLVPDELPKIVHKALTKDRNERYQSIAEFRLQIEALPLQGWRLPSSVSTAVHSPVDDATANTLPFPKRDLGDEHPASVALVLVDSTKPAEPANLSIRRGVFRNIIWAIQGRLVNLRQRFRTWRPNAVLSVSRPAVSGGSLLPDDPPGEIDVRLIHTVISQELHSYAEVIAAFLDALFIKGSKFSGNILHLSSPRFSTNSPHEYYALIIGEHGLKGNPVATLGTRTFIENFATIEDHIMSIERNVKKMVLVISASRSIGVGVHAKIHDYRENLDITVVPLQLHEIQRAQRHNRLLPTFLLELVKWHADDSRILSTRPSSEASQLTGVGSHLHDCVAFLSGERVGVLLLRGAPFSGKTSLINAAIAERNPTRVLRAVGVTYSDTSNQKDAHACTGSAIHVDELRNLGDSRPGTSEIIIFDDADLLSPVNFSELDIHVRRQLRWGRYVIISCWRLHPSVRDLLWIQTCAGFARHEISLLPLFSGSFIPYMRAQLSFKNVTITDDALTILHELSGGYIGLAKHLLNSAIRLAVSIRQDCKLGLLEELALTECEIVTAAEDSCISGQILHPFTRSLQSLDMEILNLSSSSHFRSISWICRKLARGRAPHDVIPSIIGLRDAGVLVTQAQSVNVAIGFLRTWAISYSGLEQEMLGPLRRFWRTFSLRGSAYSASPLPVSGERTRSPGQVKSEGEIVAARLGTPLKTFISYAHEDIQYMTQLSTHLVMLCRQGFLTPWSDQCILPGAEWDQESSQQMMIAEIIILLVSPHFLASHSCWERDVRLALIRHSAQSARVIPIIVRSCEWRETPLQVLSELPGKDMTIAQCDERNLDKTWHAITAEIRRCVTSLRHKLGSLRD